jgi:hypothetical protein
MRGTSMSWLRNRYILTLGSLAALAIAWNIYVVRNDDGIIAGRVIDGNGRPVAGATVVLSEKSLLVTIPRAETRTNSDGTFRITGHNLHHLYLEAAKEGVGRMPPKEIRLYFKGQNIFLDKPLVLAESR